MLPAALPTISGGGVAGVAQGEGAYRPGRPSPACEICDYADVHGSWPTSHRGTHCADFVEGRARRLNRGCHRSWSSLIEAHCTVCHQHFSTDRVAERHTPYCTPDREETHNRLWGAVKKNGEPLFAPVTRKDGKTWILYDPRQPWYEGGGGAGGD